MSPWTVPTLVVAAAAITALLTPAAARLAVRWGFIDRPAGHKFHAEATPLLGGLALAAGALLPLAVLRTDPRFGSFAAAAVLLVAVGLWDDRRRVSVAGKLAAQSAAALVLVGGGFRAEAPLPGWAAAVLAFLWIVGLTNACNLLDSIDGAAAGVAAVAAAGGLALAAPSPFGAALAAALLGASLGFLPYNFHPARLFMGDAGSLFLGMTLAVLGLELTAGGVSWLAVLLLFAVPLFDTTLVTVSRLRRGKNPMTHPGTDHLAHRLARRGLGVRGAVTALYLLGALGAVLAWAVS
jgi:UDP-GlcNAc:undecaprenyl-phosphate GlcNAc-1-phosphate transferase